MHWSLPRNEAVCHRVSGFGRLIRGRESEVLPGFLLRLESAGRLLAGAPEPTACTRHVWMGTRATDVIGIDSSRGRREGMGPRLGAGWRADELDGGNEIMSNPRLHPRTSSHPPDLEPRPSRSSQSDIIVNIQSCPLINLLFYSNRTRYFYLNKLR